MKRIIVIANENENRSSIYMGVLRCLGLGTGYILVRARGNEVKARYEYRTSRNEVPLA